MMNRSARWLVATAFAVTMLPAAAAASRKFHDREAGFKIDVPYTFRATTKVLPKGEFYWEWESSTTEKGARVTGDARLVLRVEKVGGAADALKLLLAYQKGGMRDRMPTSTTVVAAHAIKEADGTVAAFGYYEGLRPRGDSKEQARYHFKVYIEIRKGRAYYQIVELIHERYSADEMAKLASIFDKMVIE